MHLRQDLVLPISIYGLVPVLFAGGQTIQPAHRFRTDSPPRCCCCSSSRASFSVGLWLSVGDDHGDHAIIWTAGGV